MSAPFVPPGSATPQPPAPTQPAGWYPDPTNPRLVRWWDGTTWPPEVAARPAVQPAPPHQWGQTAPGHGGAYPPAFTVEPVTRHGPWRRLLVALLIIVPVIATAALIAVAVSRAEEPESSVGSVRSAPPLLPITPPTTEREIVDYIDRPWERIELPGGGGSVEFPTGSIGESLSTTTGDGEPLVLPVRFVGDGNVMSSTNGLLVGNLPVPSGRYSFDSRVAAEGAVSGAGGTLTDFVSERSRFGNAARFRGNLTRADVRMLGYFVHTRRGVVLLTVFVPTDQADVGELTLERLVTSLKVG